MRIQAVCAGPEAWGSPRTTVQRPVAHVVCSIRVVVAHDDEDGLEDDDEVEPQRPVAQVVEVVLDAAIILSRVSVSPRKPLTCAQPVMPGLTLWRSM